MSIFKLSKTGAEVEQAIKQEYDNDFRVNSPRDDLSGALFAAKLDVSSWRLDYDVFNAWVSFQSNARYPQEPVVISVQAKHAMVLWAGAVARPHFHRLQQQADIPNFILGYKLTNYGEPTVFETNRDNFVFTKRSANVFVYPWWTFAQITKFPEIDISSLTISWSIDYVLFRDNADNMGLFWASDPVSWNVTVKYNDWHYKFNQNWSRQEFVK